MISAPRFNTSLALFPIRRAPGFLCILLLATGLFACRSSEDENGETNAPPVIEVTARDHAFQAPDLIPSGWTTFRMNNEGEEHHLFVLVKPPPGITYSEYQAKALGPLDSLRSALKAGSIDTTGYQQALARALPDWFPGQLQTMGGVGLTAPGRMGTTTINLEPGTYTMSCYAKTPEGTEHAFRGMIRPLVVTTDSTRAPPPEAGRTVTLSKLRVQADSVVPSGEHTVAVRFGKKRKGGPIGYFLQHLHLARLTGETGAEEVAQWMKSVPVMPAPVEFVGGPQDMPTGHTAYMHVDLTPGRYAWVLGNPPKQGSVTPFTVE